MKIFIQDLGTWLIPARKKDGRFRSYETYPKVQWCSRIYRSVKLITIKSSSDGTRVLDIVVYWRIVPSKRTSTGFVAVSASLYRLLRKAKHRRACCRVSPVLTRLTRLSSRICWTGNVATTLWRIFGVNFVFMQIRRIPVQPRTYLNLTAKLESVLIVFVAGPTGIQRWESDYEGKSTIFDG